MRLIRGLQGILWVAVDWAAGIEVDFAAEKQER